MRREQKHIKERIVGVTGGQLLKKLLSIVGSLGQKKVCAH